MKEVKSRTGEKQLQTREYAPRGPVILAKHVQHPEPPALTQEVAPLEPRPLTKVRCTAPGRISGRLYDAHSGVEIGLASDEQKTTLLPGVRYTRIIGGMKQEFVIEP